MLFKYSLERDVLYRSFQLPVCLTRSCCGHRAARHRYQKEQKRKRKRTIQVWNCFSVSKYIPLDIILSLNDLQDQ